MLAFNCPKKLTFLFGDLRPDDPRSVAAIPDFADHCRRLDNGVVPYRQREPILQKGLIAVVPFVMHSAEARSGNPQVKFICHHHDLIE